MFNPTEARELANALECKGLAESCLDCVKGSQAITEAINHIDQLQRGIAELDRILRDDQYSYLECVHGRFQMWDGDDLEVVADSVSELITKLGERSE